MYCMYVYSICIEHASGLITYRNCDIIYYALFRLFKLCLVAHPSESKRSPTSSVEYQLAWTKASTGTIQVTGAMWTQFKDLELMSSGFLHVAVSVTVYSSTKFLSSLCILDQMGQNLLM
jgi:hypothetical protein